MADGKRVVRTSCRGCHGVCQVLVHMDAQGRVARVSGDPESPTSRGYICCKGRTAPELLNHPDRLLKSLRRSGSRESGQWKTISWEKALSEMAGVFDRVRRQSGPEYIALCQGTGRPYSEFTGRFIHALGSPNFATRGHNCFIPRTIASGITLGWMPFPDIYGLEGQMPACILQIGQNSPAFGATDGICGGMIRRAMNVTREVIVVDPRRMHPEPRVDVHPKTAFKFSLEAGRKISVVTPHGRAQFTVHLDDGLHPSVVHVEHAWWFPEEPGPDHGWRRSCANLLFGHEYFDADSGAELLKSGICRLEKI